MDYNDYIDYGLYKTPPNVEVPDEKRIKFEDQFRRKYGDKEADLHYGPKYPHKKKKKKRNLLSVPNFTNTLRKLLKIR
jgi:hypothetical protein